MASIERRNGRYRVKCRDPSNRQRSRTFTRKADADRFLVEVEADLARGQWVDPAGARISLAERSDTFLSLCRRLERTSRDTYERDLRRYIVPRFGHYRIGQLPRAGRVRITEQLLRLGAGEWQRKEPKTPASVRSITLSPALVELMSGHVDQHANDGPDGLVFTSSRGTPLISSSFLTHHFGPARRSVVWAAGSTTCATRR